MNRSDEGSRAIVELAFAARRALENRAHGNDSLFRDFPLGACGPAAELVGRALSEKLGLRSVYVCGVGHPNLAPNQSHAWTEVGPFIVDLTHDQFSDTGVAGWVLPSTSEWHGLFRDMDRRDGFCMPAGWPMYPHGAYRAILAQLEA